MFREFISYHGLQAVLNCPNTPYVLFLDGAAVFWLSQRGLLVLLKDVKFLPVRFQVRSRGRHRQ